MLPSSQPVTPSFASPILPQSYNTQATSNLAKPLTPFSRGSNPSTPSLSAGSNGFASLQPSYPSSFPVTRPTINAASATSSSSISTFKTLEPTVAQSHRSNPSLSSSYNSGRPNYDLNGTGLTNDTSTVSKPQWNVMQPQSSRPETQNSRHPLTNSMTTATTTTKATMSPPPPGYNSGGFVDVLKPKVVSPPTKPSSQNFGDWKDFDPLK